MGPRQVWIVPRVVRSNEAASLLSRLAWCSWHPFQVFHQSARSQIFLLRDGTAKRPNALKHIHTHAHTHAWSQGCSPVRETVVLVRASGNEVVGAHARGWHFHLLLYEPVLWMCRPQPPRVCFFRLVETIHRERGGAADAPTPLTTMRCLPNAQSSKIPLNILLKYVLCDNLCC